MIDVRVIVIFFLLPCPLVIMSPLRGGEGENGEQCPGNYCSMFEGICKNGGTCISKGCKGECKCTKDFTGHNCEVPIIALTTLAPEKETEAPKKKETKSTTENSNEKMSVILSLFRMMSRPRPEVTNHIVKKENVKKLSSRKDSDKDSQSVDRKRENYPSRSEPLSERKQDEISNEKEVSDRSKESQRIKQLDKSNTQENAGEPESKSLIEEKVDKNIVSTSESVDKNEISTVEKKMSDKHTTELSLTLSDTVKIKNTTPITTTQATFSAIQAKSVEQVNQLTSTTSSGLITTYQSTPSTRITTPDKAVTENRVREDAMTFSGKTRKVVPKVFHAPHWRFLLQEQTTTVKTDVLIDEKKDGQQKHSSSNNSDILAHMANAGHKVLSSTTLSNMYPSHTLLSKSRIFVSTVPNKTARDSTKKPPVTLDNASTQSQIQNNGVKTFKERSTSIDLAKEEIALAAKRLVIEDNSVVTTTSLPTKSIKAEKTDESNLVTETQFSYVKSTSQMLKQGTQNMATKTSAILPIPNKLTTSSLKNLETTTGIGMLGNSPITVIMSTTKSPSKPRLRKSLLSHNSGDIQNHKRT